MDLDFDRIVRVHQVMDSRYAAVVDRQVDEGYGGTQALSAKGLYAILVSICSVKLIALPQTSSAMIECLAWHDLPDGSYQ